MTRTSEQWAPPAPRRAAPAMPPGRVPVRQLVAGVASGIVLLVVVVGLPVLLTLVAPASALGPATDWSDGLTVLLRRDDGTLLRLALTVLAWGAWLVMVGSVLLEVGSVVRRRPTPRIPLLRVPQQGAAALVAAVVLALAPTANSPGSTHVPDLPNTSPVALTMSEPARGYGSADTMAWTPGGAAAVSARGSHRVTTEPTITVRRHDTLWALAERHLGSGPRFREIVALNLGRPQADGRALTDAHWIYPGWVLRLPPDAVGARGSAPAPAQPRPPVRAPAMTTVVPAAAAAVDRGPLTPEKGVRHLIADRPLVRPGATSATGQDTGVAPVEPVEVAPVLALGLGALTVGTVLAEVARQRRRRQGVRQAGDRLPPPVPGTLRAERVLRAVADDERGARVRDGLSALAASCRQHGRALPAVAWVRVGATTLELVLADDDDEVVPPFVRADARTWSWAGDVPGAPDGEDLPDPYPALVSVGLDGDELVLVNLEAAGTLRVAGEPPGSGQVMAAMAVDLMGRNRSGAVTVSVVPGLFDVPVPLVVAREVRSAEAAAAQVGEHQQEVGIVLAQCGVGDVRAARSQGVADETWAPEVVLGRQVPMTAAAWSGAAVVHGGVATDGEWALSPDQGELWRLDPPGITVVPQRLDPDAQQSVVNLVAGVPRARESAEDPTLAAQVTRVRAALERVPVRDRGEPGAPRVLLLGPVVVTGVDDGAAPGRSRRAAELVAYLVLHPGVGRHVLDEVLWPGRRVGRSTRNPFVSRTRQWLGRTPQGEAYLPLVAETGEYRLRPEITCDWDDFVAASLRGTVGGEVDLDELSDALALVRGRPFQGIDPATYCWADPDVQEMVSAIVDVAHLLAAASYAAGDLRTSASAAARGLAVEPVSELLHRDALLAAHGLGEPALSRAVGRLTASLEEDEDLMPETVALLEDLGVRLDR